MHKRAQTRTQILELCRGDQLTLVQDDLFKLLAACLASPHFQVQTLRTEKRMRREREAWCFMRFKLSICTASWHSHYMLYRLLPLIFLSLSLQASFSMPLSIYIPFFVAIILSHLLYSLHIHLFFSSSSTLSLSVSPSSFLSHPLSPSLFFRWQSGLSISGTRSICV